MPESLPLLGEPPATPLPTVAALEELWDAVSARPLWAPPNLLRYLRLRFAMRLSLLDPERVTVVSPPGKVNDCGACNDLCCVGPRAAVLLRLRDIATLHDIGRTDLISTTKPSFDPTELAARPALRRHVASAAWRIFPTLSQRAGFACGALTDAGKCSLYPHWPLSCARFPYSLHLEDADVFYSRRCDSFWIHPSAGQRAQRMVTAAVRGYNERIKDFVLLTYARTQLEHLGLTRFLRAQS